MSCSFYMAPQPTVLRPEDVALYLGKRGSGKSTLAKALAGRCMQAGQRILALDPHDEWSQEGRKTDQVVLGPLTQRFEAWQVLSDLSILEDPELCAAIVPGSRNPKEWAEAFVPIIEMALDVGDLTLFFEEQASWGMYCAEQLDAAALNSRHSRVPLCAIGQRAYRVSRTFRSQATVISSGLQTEPPDLDALEDVAGKDFAEAVRQLKRGQWCLWRDDMGGPRPSTRRKKKP